jgi:hypothetical protein
MNLLEILLIRKYEDLNKIINTWIYIKYLFIHAYSVYFQLS